MFTKKSRIITSTTGLDNYIEGYDIYNARLLVLLSDPGVEREEYEITTLQYRPDLIAKAFYGSDAYEGLLMIQAARGLEDYKKGAILRLIPKDVLDGIISNI